MASPQPLLRLNGLKVSIDSIPILHGIDLEVRPGEIHAIMGPNGSGKSTLSAVLMGNPAYTVTQGKAVFEGANLLKLDPEDRAALGLFLSFQYPKEIPGVNLVSFLRASYNAVKKAQIAGKTQAKKSAQTFEPVSLFAFKKKVMDMMSLIGLPASFMERATNEGFSGGEKKKCEILQMALLEPKLAILDETDSGLDVDALKDICHAILAVRDERKARGDVQSIVLITHYQRILNYIMPDHVHVMMDGKIVMSGGADLAHTIEARGYDFVREHLGAGHKKSKFQIANSK